MGRDLEGEVFDPTPYVGAYVRYFVRHPLTQLMPRKIKTAFDGTPAEDRSITGIHDIAFISKIREDGIKGFEVRVGGGTSIMARVAPTLYDFVEADNGDYLKVAEAVFRIFDAQDWLRVNRARARIKVFVDKFGIDELRNQVEEQLKGDWVAERDFGRGQRLLRLRRGGQRPARAAVLWHPDRRRGPRRVRPLPRVQRRRPAPGGLLRRRGQDLPGRSDARAVPLASARSCATSPAATPARPCSQNIVLRWVRDEALYDLWNRLKELGARRGRRPRDHRQRQLPRHRLLQARDHLLDGPEPGDQAASCWRCRSPTRSPAASTSRTPAARTAARQHHIADIGFYGASIKVGEHTIPAYVPHIGGVYEGGEVGLRPAPESPPARQACPRRRRALDPHVRGRARHDGETFKAYAERVGTIRFEEAVKGDLAMPVEFSLDTMNMFMDWDRNQPYVVARGEGECAA